MIKAIETKYKGYRFRSRLEARWAVFFDAMGIKYEYEKEGYDLGELGWYLPDFWLPEFEMFIEIKPSTGVLISSETKAFKKLMVLHEMTTSPTLLCMGNPKEFRNLLYTTFTTNSGGGAGDWDATFVFDTEAILVTTDTRSNRVLLTADWCALNHIVTLYDEAKKRFIRACGREPKIIKLLNQMQEDDFDRYDRSENTDYNSRTAAIKASITEVINQILEDEFNITDISENTDSYSCRAAIKARQARFEHGEMG